MRQEPPAPGAQSGGIDSGKDDRQTTCRVALKLIYLTRRQAKMAMLASNRKWQGRGGTPGRLGIYRCPYCDGYHVGNQYRRRSKAY